MEPKSILWDKLCKSSTIGVYARIPFAKMQIDKNKKVKNPKRSGTSID